MERPRRVERDRDMLVRAGAEAMLTMAERQAYRRGAVDIAALRRALAYRRWDRDMGKRERRRWRRLAKVIESWRLARVREGALARVARMAAAELAR